MTPWARPSVRRRPLRCARCQARVQDRPTQASTAVAAQGRNWPMRLRPERRRAGTARGSPLGWRGGAASTSGATSVPIWQNEACRETSSSPDVIWRRRLSTLDAAPRSVDAPGTPLSTRGPTTGSPAPSPGKGPRHIWWTDKRRPRPRRTGKRPPSTRRPTNAVLDPAGLQALSGVKGPDARLCPDWHRRTRRIPPATARVVSADPPAHREETVRTSKFPAPPVR